MWRRDFLRQTAGLAGSALPGAALVQGCMGLPEVPTLVSTFEASSDSVLVHVRARGETALVEAWPAGSAAPTVSASSPIGDRSVAIDLAGLSADTDYEYQASVDGLPTASGRFRTAPVDDADIGFSFVFFADFDSDPTYDSPILASMLDTPSAFAISLGDFPYAYPYADPSRAAVTPTEYDRKHELARAHPGMQALLGDRALFATWDDHEVVNDWDADFTARDPARVVAATTAWHDWFPLRDTVHRSWRWGRHAELFLLDARSFRSSNEAPDDVSKTMLGQAQKEWLLAAVLASTATFKIVISVVPLDFATTGSDSWVGFRTERDEILGAIAAAGVSGLLVLTGDQHWFGAYAHDFGVRAFQTGPVASTVRAPAGSQPGMLHVASRLNYGVVTVRTDGTLVVQGRGVEGEVFYEETLTVADLTPTQP